MKAVMDHIVLNAEDIEALVRFYTTIVELEPERLTEFRSGKAPFPSVRLNPDTVIDLAPRVMWESARPRTLGSTELESLLSHARQGGMGQITYSSCRASNHGRRPASALGRPWSWNFLLLS